jgi:hypothetical protein
VRQLQTGEESTAYPFSSVVSHWADGAELKCLTDASNGLSAWPCKLAVPVTCFSKLLACGQGKKGSILTVTIQWQLAKLGN